MLTLETMYYVVGIIAMSLWIVVAIASVIIVYQVHAKMKSFETGIKGKVATLLQERNKEAAAAVGIAIVKLIVEKLRKKTRRS